MQMLIIVVFLIGHSQSDESQRLDGNVSNFAVVNGRIYVTTDDGLYQMHRNLTVEIRSDTKQGDRVKILVPFEKENKLIICGTHACGYCEALNLKNISKTIYKESLAAASIYPNESSLGFLVHIGDSTNKLETYLLTAAVPKRPVICDIDPHFLTLRNTNNLQDGGIFSAIGDQGSLYVEHRYSAWMFLGFEFVDGFQCEKHIYIFANFNISGPQPRVRLLSMKKGTKKTNTLDSFRGTTIHCCGSKTYTQLASSAVVGGSPLLWAGVFKADSESTALAIFNISQGDIGDGDPDFCVVGSCSNSFKEGSQNMAPKAIYEYPSMTSVAVSMDVNVSSWTMFFIGTADGQLIKISMDKGMKPTCPIVLYRSNDERPVHSKMILDPVDKKHIYLALGKQMKRVPVARCERYNSMRDCWLSHDPLCGWCASASRCTFHDECLRSTWITIPDGSVQEQMISFQVDETPSHEEIIVSVTAHLRVVAPEAPVFSCAFTTEQGESLCTGSEDTAVFPNCSCVFFRENLPAGGLGVTVMLSIDNQTSSESWNLKNCSLIQGKPTFALCSECVAAGCLWSFTQGTCAWMPLYSYETDKQDTCQKYSSGGNFSKPEIDSIHPNEISFYGKNYASITGKHLDHVTKIRIHGNNDCNLKKVPFQSRSSDRLTLHIPGGNKGRMTVCVELPDGTCYGSAVVTYRSLPACDLLTPSTSWASGGRAINILGTNLQFVDWIEYMDPPQKLDVKFNSSNLVYYAPSSGAETRRNTTFRLKVANETIRCATLTYHPDPEFSRFTTSPSGDGLRITIEKKVDKLNISEVEMNIFALEGDAEYKCENIQIQPSHLSGVDSIDCQILNKANSKIQLVKIRIGNYTFEVTGPRNMLYWIILIVIIIPAITIVFGWIYLSKRKKLSEQMNKRLELLECDIRKEIRQGFVDMQILPETELTENAGAIPFLDYKHFASRFFFPDETMMSGFLKDLDQASERAQTDRGCEALSGLIRNRLFLTSFVHALEEQRNFSMKDKCHVASLLTLALHSDLPYLTEVMEVLLRALMDQSSNAQPKLMLRRTESIVEKLLTNWMSICLYGYLRESVGQNLFLLVSALNQQISKGPVDSVTEKALYTLNEDSLLWQAQDFSALKLSVSLEVASVGEGDAPLEVSVLDCDTVEQVKEKILRAFKSKFGFPYSGQLKDIDIVYEKGGSSLLLQEVDSSSEVLGAVTMLNTLRHYKIPDGASVKVITKEGHAPLTTQASLKDDKNYSIKYFHLIDPDIDDQSGNPERKKLKLKEVYLTKLLSTKVAVHSYVEKLFRSIWGATNNRVPLAVKYFFDFLDAQGDSKKISDPDVLHIWKTNSLPLRFWVNILKNPQFVFDMEKTPLLDGCLSVIAQAFMDSFSLVEQHLDKHSPTNKLLYAKDIPQYKQEVKDFYKQVRDLAGFSNAEFKAFLQEESKKHENEFNESAALREIYKYLQQHFNAIEEKLVQDGASRELKDKLHQVKDFFTEQKSCSWD
ncbi:plexin-C1 isoform X2 [Conger conger]|uniref:plexin-C1 isoform X2 n=1 Tax=Conger conger TaxID=82655 RepID=UPI002A5A7BE9|nr:plexin-C1 isoform X2 [Conger conger]